MNLNFKHDLHNDVTSYEHKYILKMWQPVRLMKLWNFIVIFWLSNVYKYLSMYGTNNQNA